MQRVQTLAEQLNEKLKAGAGAKELLHTVKMLEAELLHLSSNAPPSGSAAVHIAIPVQPVPHVAQDTVAKPEREIDPEPEKIIEVLQVSEEDIDAELEEIRRNAEERNKISVQNKPAVIFDADEEIPTLARSVAPPKSDESAELNERIKPQTASLNEKLAAPAPELADHLETEPIKDLRKAIGVNDRYLYINELFRGDEAMYERSIKTINGFSIFGEAEFWIRRELKLKLGWDENADAVRRFDHLVRRRFS